MTVDNKKTLLEGTVVQSDMRGDTCTACSGTSHTHPPCHRQQFLGVTLPPKALFSFKTKQKKMHFRVITEDHLNKEKTPGNNASY